MKMLLLSTVFLTVSNVGGKLLPLQGLDMLQLSPKVSVAISSNRITITKISIQGIVTLQGMGIISLGMAEAGEDVFSNNGIRTVVSKLGTADLFLSIKPVVLSYRYFFALNS